jgi:hypothetical protein
MSTLNQNIKDGIRLMENVIEDLGKFARTKTEKNYLSQPVMRARSRLADVLVKVEFLENAHAQKINTSRLGHVGKPKRIE